LYVISAYCNVSKIVGGISLQKQKLFRKLLKSIVAYFLCTIVSVSVQRILKCDSM